MPIRLLSVTLAAALAAPSASAPAPPPRRARAPAPTADVNLRGSVADLRAGAGAPPVLVSQAKLDELARAWGIANVPRVNFRTHLLLVGTTCGPRVDLQVSFSGDGDLVVTSPRPGRGALRPGFRYQILAVPRSGVRTVGGQPIPAE